MLANLLLILGCAVISIALRGTGSPLWFRVGNLCVLGTSFLLGWRLTGNKLIGAFCASSWLLFPWIDIVTRVRNMQMPSARPLRPQAPPGSTRFPMLGEITEEMEAEGFEHLQDAGWDTDEQRQFVRLCIHPTLQIRATINLVESPEVSFYYITLSSRAADGTLWLTWNYPFSSSLKPSPNWRIQRLRGAHGFLELNEAHLDWIHRLNAGALVAVEPDPEKLIAEIEHELQSQLDHNLACGVLTTGDPGLVRYSWRGCFFLWTQFLRDLLRA